MAEAIGWFLFAIVVAAVTGYTKGRIDEQKKQDGR